MKKIAIPVFENRISNRLDCSETLFLYSIEKGQIKSHQVIRIVEDSPSAKLNMLIGLGIDVLICNGITDFYSNNLIASNIQVIPWVSGEVTDVLYRYLKGKLISIN